MKGRLIISLLAGVFIIAGCQPPMPELSTLATTDKLVGSYNQNAEKIPRLWARAKIEISGIRKGLPFVFGSTSPLADPNGLLILQKNPDPTKPSDYVLLFRELSTELARLGISNKDNAYYVWNIPMESCVFGDLNLAGNANSKMPLDPLGIESILAVTALPKSQTSIPFVAQRVQQSRPFAQVLYYMDHQLGVADKGNVVFKRELYFRWQRDPKDRDKLLPRELFMVKLLDDKGMTVMTAELNKYREIELEDVENEDAPCPKMPTDIRLTWHGRNEKVHIVLDEMTTADKFDPAALEFRRWVPDQLKNKVRKVK